MKTLKHVIHITNFKIATYYYCSAKLQPKKNLLIHNTVDGLDKLDILDLTQHLATKIVTTQHVETTSVDTAKPFDNTAQDYLDFFPIILMCTLVVEMKTTFYSYQSFLKI